MKKYLFIILLAFSCDTISYVEYKIVNNSSYNIKIESFYKRIKYDSIEILSKRELVIPDIYDGRGGTKSIFSPQKNIEYLRDSVVIIFSNKKVIKQWCDGKDLRTCTDIPKNIANIAYDTENLINDKKRKGFKKYIGTISILFSDADNTNATPL
ncbi:MAG: hypothetical protein MUF43_13400 [Flavobacterium sp.]|jgi:hypothetical protein|nr:hypothetical protein [Flavobacterium sp.]